MWQTSGTAMKQCSVKLDNQKGAPTVKDLIIANMINSLIVYNVYYMYRCALRESDNKFHHDFTRIPFFSVTI